MIHIEKVKNCNGCCACVDVCTTNAISLKIDIEGFWYPKINSSSCTDCDLCENVCPELHVLELKKNDFEKPICYAAHHKNIEIHFDSTSGGLFSALATQTYKEGGYVGGAIYNDDFSVQHIISNNENDLEKLRSSKYLQSNASGLYKKIKDLVLQREKVLVCGTPCQMAALRRFLRKDYENLIIVDFICLGVNSPKVFRKYLDSLELKFNSKVNYVKAKNKELGWRALTTRVAFENGKFIYDTIDTNLFTQGYIGARAYCRLSCYACQFKGFPRIADITLADFWGIEKVNKSLDNDLGTSMVLLNSNKGVNYFENIKTNIIYHEVSFETILPGNKALVSPLAPSKIDRASFFKDLNLATFDDIAKKYFSFSQKKFKQRIKSILHLILAIKQISSLRPKALYQLLRYNFFCKAVSSNLKLGSLFIPAPYSVIEIHNKATVKITGTFKFGKKKFKRSKLESRILVDKNAKLFVNGNFSFGYGCDIEVFEGAQLIINGGGASNLNTTLICGEKIVIGNNVKIGRDVTIRDNHGDHYISLQGYKNSRPVIIGNHVWLGSNCNIMPGVKIGDGAIVAAGSLVLNNVPARSIVSGSPAKVLFTDISWKY